MKICFVREVRLNKNMRNILFPKRCELFENFRENFIEVGKKKKKMFKVITPFSGKTEK